MRTKILILLMLWLAAQPGSGAGFDYHAGANFDQLLSFLFLEDLRPDVEVATLEVSAEVILEAVETALTARGLQRVSAADEANEAALIVIVNLGRDRIHPGLNVGYPSQWRHRRDSDIHTWRDGVMTIDLVHRETSTLIWRGWDEESLKSNAEKRTRQLQRMVRRIIEQYPPRL